jgi:hypothetical protein
LHGLAVMFAVDNARVAVQFGNLSPNNPTTFDHQTAMCRFSNQISNLHGFVMPLIEQHMQTIRANDSRIHLEGEHHSQTDFECAFDPGTFFINDHEVVHFTVSVNYTISVRYPGIIIKFDVEHRGGLIRMEYPSGTFGHKDMVLEILTKPSDQFSKKSQ